MTEVTERPKISDLTNDEIVRLVVQIRDQTATEKKVWETRKAALDEKADKLKAVLLARYKELGIESARTQYGTAYKVTAGRGSIADKEIVWGLLNNPDLHGLVTLMPNKAGIKQYIEEHNDIPPGFNWYEEVELRVNRA
jgi:hypothetical protein